MTPRHAPPFRFTDRILECAADRCVVLTLVSASGVAREPGAAGTEDLPLTLVIEAMAQAALPLLADREAAGGANRSAGDLPQAATVEAPGLLVGFDGVRLSGRVRPGDRLRITSEIVARLGRLIRIRGQVDIDEVRVAEAEFTVVSGSPVDGVP